MPQGRLLTQITALVYAFTELLEDSLLRHETSLLPLGQELLQYLRLCAASLMTALVSMLAGQCSCAEDHSLTQHTINSMTELDDCESLGNTLHL